MDTGPDLKKKPTRNNNKETCIQLQELKSLVCDALCAVHMPEPHATQVADCLAESDACGVASHGVATLPAHISKIKGGHYNLNPSFASIRNGPAFDVIDADTAIGFVSGAHCMNRAIDGCRQTGIFTVFSRNSNTYGAAFYYPQLAAQHGLIGITASNSPAAMAAWNGTEKLFGTNPFAAAIPCEKADPIIFDMATSKVAKSKIKKAADENRPIPDDWALNSEGLSTTDPSQAIDGFMLPMDGYKGYGLALTIDILAGVLSGAAFLNNVGKFYNDDEKGMNVGQIYIAIDPVQVYGEAFYQKMDDYIQTVISSGDSHTRVRLPGQRKAANRKDSIQQGICLPQTTVAALNRCFAESGLGIRL